MLWGLEEGSSASSVNMPVCAPYKTDGSDLLSSSRGATNEARNVAGYLCRRLLGETPARIAKEFHLDDCGSVSSVVSRMEKTLVHDASLRKRVGRVQRELKKTQNQP